MIKIEKGVAIVEKGPTRHPKYPLAEMEVGDSFWIPGKDETVRSAAYAAGKRFAGRKYITRAMNGGVRVWRTA